MSVILLIILKYPFSFQVEKEVIECMTRALKYLDVELNCPLSDRYSLAKYRAGTIHHRLASLLHNSFRTEVCFQFEIHYKFCFFSQG